jgi:hypothetical protein
MKRFHLVFGVVVVIVFLITGQYMEFQHVSEMDDGPRVLYRSRHIYLLLAGLVNLGLGLYVSYHPRGWRRTMQMIGSALIILAPPLLLAGFITEPDRGAARTMIAAFGIFAVALGMLFHLISSLREKEAAHQNRDRERPGQ